MHPRICSVTEWRRLGLPLAVSDHFPLCVIRVAQTECVRFLNGWITWAVFPDSLMAFRPNFRWRPFEGKNWRPVEMAILGQIYYLRQK